MRWCFFAPMERIARLLPKKPRGVAPQQHLTFTGFHAAYAAHYTAKSIFVKALFGWLLRQCLTGEAATRTSMYLFLCNLSESSFSCSGARTGVPVYPERGLAVGLPRQQGTVQAWWWKTRGSGLIGITGDARGHLCALRYPTTLLSRGGKRDFFFLFFLFSETKLNETINSAG